MKINTTIINNIKNNIFYRSQAAIEDYHNFDWHKNKIGIPDTDKINSSQALTIDFWGCLRNSPEKDKIINYLFNRDEYDWDIKFEYTEKELLNEPKPTQIDVLLVSTKNAIVIESKFKERDGGGCSQINRNKKGYRQCNGNYEEQVNPINNIKSKCALTGKGINYWVYINTLTAFNSMNNYTPCPFKSGEYQWMRNFCFAEAYSQKHKKETESYLVYYKSEKCSISKKVKENIYLGKLKGNIINKDSFKPISYNDLVSNIILFLTYNKVERNIWIELQKWIANKESKL